MAACIGTWSFSLEAVKLAKQRLLSNGSALNAVECGISFVEDDLKMGCYFVGRGGAPNSAGVLQCDAAIMNGADLAFGAVAALEGIATPICVASRVMTNSKHSFLVGAGAQQFAVNEGFVIETSETLLSKATEKDNSSREHPHDTIGLITRDRFSNIAAGVSTSGLAHKEPGRVGDSPLPGCGLYADSLAGAACATGDGDEIMKFCPSFHVVQLMKQGATPSDACQQVIKEIRTRLGSKEVFQIGVIAMNNKGECGAASTVSSSTDSVTYDGFPFCVWNEGQEEPVIFCVPPTL